jgi:hypothetical protein
MTHARKPKMLWRPGLRAVRILLPLALAACGGDSAATAPDPAISPFVGDWTATTLIVTNVAVPDQSADLLAVGASFNLNIQESGQYTAVLVILGQAQTEIGKVRVTASTITFLREFPSAESSVSEYSFDGPDRLTLDGDTEFDFNLDGIPEASLAHFVLVRS